MAAVTEALDVSAVDRWLKSQVAELRGVPKVTQYSGGASNWTYRLEYENRDLVLRRPPAGTKAKSAHDMAREHGIQLALKPHYPVVPTMVALCQDQAVLGCDFYVMERIDGLIPRKHLPKELHLDAAQTRALCLSVLDRLVELHRVDFRAAGLGHLYKGDGYVQRQLSGWTERYAKARTWNVATFENVTRWLAERAPKDRPPCVIHNDWRFDNVVLDPREPTRVVGVLDWELATVGDPLMELGSALAYWVEAKDGVFMQLGRRQPTHLPGMLTRAEVVEYYLAKTGLSTDDWAFYEVFGLFRLAGIAQQIYYRYHHGQSRNPAFRFFWVLINSLAWRCRMVMRRAR